MILAISGSLRRHSLNAAALRAAARAAARRGIAVELDDSPRRLPQFNPDLEADPPEIVQRFRAACVAAEGVIFAVPEYAFGIPGSLKNALDWTVGDGSLYWKPVAVLSVAPPGRGAHVGHALRRVLDALDCRVSWHHVPLHPTLIDEGEVRDPRLAGDLARVVTELNARAQLGSGGADPALSA